MRVVFIFGIAFRIYSFVCPSFSVKEFLVLFLRTEKSGLKFLFLGKMHWLISVNVTTYYYQGHNGFLLLFAEEWSKFISLGHCLVARHFCIIRWRDMIYLLAVK